MKNLKVIILAILAINFAGCKKFLDQKPITQQDETVVFSDVANTRRAIAGVYSQLTGDQGYGIRLSLYYTVDTDEMQGPGSNPLGDNDRRDISRYKTTPGNAQIGKPFNQLFQGIEFANNCIEGIPKSPVYSGGSEKEKKQMQRMLGEALTLRAQFYFEAIRNWGDLPEHFGSAAAIAAKDAFPKRTNRDLLYDQIIADLKTAADLMPWRNEVAAIDDIDERITKGTAKALRARIALFRGGYSLRNDTKTVGRSADYLKYYQIARDECKEIMDAGQHSLNPSYKSLWKDQVCGKAIVDPNGELMFQVSAIGGGSGGDTKLGYYNGPSVNNKGNRSINVLPTYFYQFDSLDLRRDVTCVAYSGLADGVTKAGTTGTTMVDGKYRRDWTTMSPTSDVQYLGLKWQIIRYADVLLMFAEAENEISSASALAYDAVNMLIRRGHGKPLNSADPTIDLPSGLGKADFFKHIVKQRSLELGGEGVRKFDLIRWNLLEKALTESKNNLLQLANGSAITDVTYMAGYPSYSLTTALPKNMFYKNATTLEDNTMNGIWMNSLYNYTPFTNPNISYPSVTTNYTIGATDYEVAYLKGQTLTATLPSAAANIGKIYWVKLAPTNPAAIATASWTYNLKVAASGGEKIDGSTNPVAYSGTVAAAGTGNPPTTSFSSRTMAFLATSNGWQAGTSVAWISGTIKTGILDDRYASGFITNKSELLPLPQAAINANYNLSQNPNY